MSAKRICCMLVLLLLAMPFFAGCLSQSAGVTAACTGYSAGQQGKGEQLSFENKEARLLPGELVRAAALLAANEEGFEDETVMARVIFDYDAVYMKAVVAHLGSPDALLEKMNALAKDLGMKDTVFGSLTGTIKGESALYAALELAQPEFRESKSTTSDLLLLAEKLYNTPKLSALYGVRAYEFQGESAPKTRNALLLRQGSDQYLESAVMYLSGTVVDAGGKVTGVALAAVKEDGLLAFSAVADHSGLDDPYPYMASDAGNLCGKALGKSYGLNQSPQGSDVSEGERTVFLGTNLFYVIIFFVLAIVAVLFVIGTAIAIVNTMKRNIEGRKKYAPPKDLDTDKK